jgi:hypothetical protein
MAIPKPTLRMKISRLPSTLCVVILLIAAYRSTAQAATTTTDASDGNDTEVPPITIASPLGRLQDTWQDCTTPCLPGICKAIPEFWGNCTAHHFPDLWDSCRRHIPELWYNLTSRHIPALLGSLQSALTNHSSSAIALSSAPSAAVLTLLGYNSFVASVRRNVEPQYRTLQLLSAVAAVNDADQKTRARLSQLLKSRKTQPPTLVPITLTEEDREVMIQLWNGTLENSSVGFVGKVKNGLYTTIPKKRGARNEMGLFLDVDGGHITVYLVATDIDNLLNEMGTDWVCHINNLLPDYGKGRFGRERPVVAESTVTKWAWQLWLEHQLQVDSDETDDDLHNEDPLFTFLTPGRYTCIYREAVDEEDLATMMAQRRATFLSKLKLAQPTILIVEEPQKIVEEKSTTSGRRCQRICMEECGRMWYGGILPFRTRTYGWIVQKYVDSDKTYNQGYFSIRPAPSPPSPPPPPPTLEIEWDSSSHRVGFPKWGLGKVTEYPGLTTAPWPIEKRRIVSGTARRDDDVPESAADNVIVKVALMNRPGKGWLVWRHKI